MITSTKKAYLGDAVYVEIDDFGDVVLTTENGVRETNRIVLEERVYSALLSYVGSASSRAHGDDE